jgi:hypothetical protein
MAFSINLCKKDDAKVDNKFQQIQQLKNLNAEGEIENNSNGLRAELSQ